MSRIPILLLLFLANGSKVRLVGQRSMSHGSKCSIFSVSYFANHLSLRLYIPWGCFGGQRAKGKGHRDE